MSLYQNLPSLAKMLLVAYSLQFARYTGMRMDIDPKKYYVWCVILQNIVYTPKI